MILRTAFTFAALVASAFFGTSHAANLTAGMQRGTPDLKSAGPATFAPQGILLVGDTQGATIYAIATEDKPAGSPSQPLAVEKLDDKIAAMLGIPTADLLINDMAVNPETGSVFLTVSRGKGPDAKPVIMRVDSQGKLAEFPLTDVAYSKAAIPDAPPATEKTRQNVTTDLQFSHGQVLVAGLSNEEFSSQLRVLSFPFAEVEKGTSVEIYHGSHGQFETKAPIRTFAVFDVAGEPNILAAYTCTPLVKFPLAEVKPGAKIKGKTIAELGNRNRPLDMVVYHNDGKDWLLMANSARGLMKVELADVAQMDAITARIKDTAGLAYKTIEEYKKVDQLDQLDKNHAVLLVQGDSGGLILKAVELP